MAFNLFKFILPKKQLIHIEHKNYSNSFINIIKNNKNNMGHSLSLSYYNGISIISLCVDMICDEFKSIPPLLFDKKKKEYLLSHPILDLLSNPNPDFTRNEFLAAVAKFYYITGNSYIILTGDVERPPLEMYTISPDCVSVCGNSKDIFADYYTYQTNSENLIFYRDETGGKFRYITKDRRFELWHIKDFTTQLGNDGLTGTSKLQSIYLEISQFLESNKHNLSMLLRGLRSSGIITSETALTQDQVDGIRSQLDSDYAGASNAGRPFVLSGGKFAFNELSKSLKDMDFKDLKKELKKDIALRLDIPLPLIDTDGQSYNNLKEAKLSLFDNAVLKLTKKIFEELSLLLIPRYKDLDIKNNIFSYNILTIPALREREIANIERLRNMNIMTINELRAIIELKPQDNADVIYQAINLVPIGTEMMSNNNNNSEIQKAIKLKDTLKSIKYSNGDNVYLVD